MKKLLILITSLIVVSASAFAETEPVLKADFYVSVQGSDHWSGTLSAPEGKDGPFATLARARDAVRELKNQSTTDIVVLIRGGTYRLDETVVFGLEDSGVGDATVTYSAYPGERPIFSSGHEIKGWKKVTGSLPGLPNEAQGKVWEAKVSDRFLTLYDNEGMLPRARSERFAALAGSKSDLLRFPEGQLKDWSNVEDVEIFVRPTRDWMVNMLPLASINEKAGVARTAIQATYGMNKLGVWVENVLEELDEPGEWALNTQTDKVYLWPRGQSPVFAPKLLELIRIEGSIDKDGPKDVPVRNLHFRGLTFMHGERYTLTPDDAGLQHDWDMLDKDNAMVRLRGAENCVIDQCHFLHSGSGAIRVDLYGIGNEITNNHIESMGGGGILLCGYGPGTKDVNKKNTVYNNNIHHVGEIYWHSPGIFLWQSGENRVANNLIHDTNYCGMIISGGIVRFFDREDKREQKRAIRWHEIDGLPKRPELEDVHPYLHSRNNLIEYNEIHNVMQKLGDGNGIYIRGSGPGNVIRRNFVHHLVSETNKQSGIRTDGGQMDTLIAENIIYKCKSQGMTLKLNNRFENNIIADVIAPRGIYLKIVEGPSTGASNKRNIYYSTKDDCILISEPSEGKGNVDEDSRGRETARMADMDSDFNIYFCQADGGIGQKTLAKLQRDGVDGSSRAEDPLFVDPENGDFRFKPDSPALEMGILPIDVSEIGLRGTEQTASNEN
ncbi:MAG: right-handed parallel beta-helix repeat-containing protein [Opitutales bacterium]|nr:right-handed parallel beta-helix repeat-containing protein [Opitutales bacterium]MDP4645078.1 right-handed parallel beta-helix repeat-containing protein [Opitutales bacterium]MDP4777895.1 right-handed parallel beta-helix repeat-containing protein [Opitutales bacterium]MDP5079816.1 right-handed parallel beta-helix repeat-containing protein [Opitutales bacterium]